ncbi:MAG: ABC transporter permease [Candidatus Acidiferrales bacterium]
MSSTPSAMSPMPASGAPGAPSAMPGGVSAIPSAASAISKVVAVNTFREAVRDRVLYNLVFFGLLMIGAAILMGQISIGIQRLVIINLGLSAISIIGLIMAVFIGVGLVYKEIEKRTLYTLLARPVKRWQFLVGKYGGLLLTLLVNTSFMTLGLAVALYWVGRPFVRADVTVLVAVYFILLELALVTALALFFSCFSSPMLSTLFTLAIYITGVFAADIRDFGQLTKSPLIEGFTKAVYYLVPNFHNFNAIEAAGHGQYIPVSLIWQNTLYTILYAAIVLIASSAIFSRRNLK